MYCINCGKQIPDDSKFCSFCGAKITDSTGTVSEQKIESQDSEKKNKPDNTTNPTTAHTNSTQNISNIIKSEHAEQMLSSGKKDWINIVMVIGAGLSILSLFLPIVTFSLFGYSQSFTLGSINEMASELEMESSTGGIIFIAVMIAILAIASVVLMYMKKKNIAAFCGIGEFVFAMILYIKVGNALAEYGSVVSKGPGLIVLLLGSLITVAISGYSLYIYYSKSKQHS